MAWQLTRGANVTPDGVHFTVWAPRAERLAVKLVSGEAAGEHQLARDERGVHSAHVAGARAGDDYTFLFPDGRELPDPVSRWQPHGVHGASRIVDPAAFSWSDHEWKGIPLCEYIIYELHVGTLTREGTFDAAIAELPRLKALGITAIEVMPVAQFPGTRNWGYDGVQLYAVQASYGGPDGFKRLVDAAHREGLAVILDVVYNHVGPEGNYLGEFGSYFTTRYNTPWGPAVNYDDADSDEVRRYVIDNARHWIAEYHVDALRLDAVHGIFDFGAKHLLQELRDEVHALGESLGRQVVVIGESDLNDPRLIRPAEEGGYGLDAQWSDDFHHAVHALVTGEQSGYYRDFGGVQMVAESLREPFVYAGDYSEHRRRRHGAPSTGIPRERFVVSIQNHDQVGNRAAGERFGALISPEAQRFAAAMLLLSPYVPMLFMGEEYGETNPFQYFVSHGDQGLMDAVRKGRREEFASFGWGDAVPDPADEETFRRSILDPSKADRMPHSGILALYRDLIAIRRGSREMKPDGARLVVECNAEEGWITLLRTASGSAWHDHVAVFNCGNVERSVPLPDGSSTPWRLRLSTDAAAYGGRDRIPGTLPPGMPLQMPAWGAAVLERGRA